MINFIRFRSALRACVRCDFLRREDGNIAIEAVIVMPAMFWALLCTFTMFDAFRANALNQKAAFTIGDTISRETGTVSDNYLDGMQDLFEYLTNSTDESALRISSIYYDATDETYYKDWSETRGWEIALTDQEVADLAPKLPILADQERVMVVETWSKYDPPFKTGLEHREIENFVFTRPRYAPWVCWQTCPVVD